MFARLTRSRSRKKKGNTTTSTTTAAAGIARRTRSRSRSRTRKPPSSQATAAANPTTEDGFEETKTTVPKKAAGASTSKTGSTTRGTRVTRSSASNPKPVENTSSEHEEETSNPDTAATAEPAPVEQASDSTGHEESKGHDVSLPPKPPAHDKPPMAPALPPVHPVAATTNDAAEVAARMQKMRQVSKSWSSQSLAKALGSFSRHSSPGPGIDASPALDTRRLAKKLSFSAALAPNLSDFTAANSDTHSEATTATAAASGAGAGAGAGAGKCAGAGAGAGATTGDNKPRSGLQVHLRVRPWDKPTTAATEGGDDEATPPPPAVEVVSTTEVRMNPPEASAAFKAGDEGGTYSFSHVWRPDTDQSELFSNVVQPLVDSCVDEGKNGLVFAYGMTNAGKTYTIMGEDTGSATSKAAGIVPRAISAVLERVAKYNATPVEDRQGGRVRPKHALSDFRVTVSYLEIYNEHIYDLLAPLPQGVGAERPKLSLGYRKDRVSVKNLRECRVKTNKTAMDLITLGSKSRKAAETRLNSDSSRSHAVFTITLWRKADAAVSIHGRHWAKLSIVDLAGSERGTRTRNTGARLREASSINKSVMLLMRCLQTMRINQKNHNDRLRVPFRETKLTHLFKDSLVGGGSGNTCMILCACPNSEDYDETLHIVKYGAMVQDITVVSSTAELRWNASKLKLGVSYDVDGRRVRPEEQRQALLAAAQARKRRKRNSDEAELPADGARAAGRTRKRRTRATRQQATTSTSTAGAGAAATATHGRHTRSRTHAHAHTRSKRASTRSGRAQRRATRSSRANTRRSVHSRRSTRASSAAPRTSGDAITAAAAAGADRATVVLEGDYVGMDADGLVALLQETEARLAAAEEEVAEIEARVREEMAEDMAARLAELEAFHASQAQRQVKQQQEKMSALMNLRDQRTATAKKSRATAPRRDMDGVASSSLAITLNFDDVAMEEGEGEEDDEEGATGRPQPQSPGSDAVSSSEAPAVIIGDPSPNPSPNPADNPATLTGDEYGNSEGDDDDVESGSDYDESGSDVDECSDSCGDDDDMDEAEEEMEELRMQIMECEEEILRMREKHQAAMAGITDELHDAKARAEAAERAVSAMGDPVADAAALAAAVSRAEAAESEVAEARDNEQALQTQLDAVQQSLEEAQAEAARVTAQLQTTQSVASTAVSQAVEDAVAQANMKHAEALVKAVEKARADGEQRLQVELARLRAEHDQSLQQAKAEYEAMLDTQRRRLEAASVAHVASVAATPATNGSRRRLTQFTNSDVRSGLLGSAVLAPRRDSYQSDVSDVSGVSSSPSEASSSDGTVTPSPRKPATSKASDPVKLSKALQFAGSYTKAMLGSAGGGSGTPVSHRGKDENLPPHTLTHITPRSAASSRDRDRDRDRDAHNPPATDPSVASAGVMLSPAPAHHGAPVALSRGNRARAQLLMSQLSSPMSPPMPTRTRRHRAPPNRFTPTAHGLYHG